MTMKTTREEYTYFKNVLNPYRLKQLEDFAIRNYDVFYDWAYRHGMIGEAELRDKAKKEAEGKFHVWQKFVGSEVVSRVNGLRVIKEKYGWTEKKMKQMPLLCHYDMVAPDGTGFECKLRTNVDGFYPTDDIDLDKKDSLEDEGPSYIELIYTHWDGVVRLYDISKPYNEGVWNKREKTMNEFTSTVTTSKLMYLPSQSLWVTTITLPDWDAKL